MESAIGYSAGFTYKFNLPVGFAIQPSLLYHSKASKSEGGQFNADLRVDYLELPVSFQWGPDLLFFRPFLDVSPYLGYGLNHDLNFKEYDVPDSSTAIVKDSWSLVNRLEYGLGLGAVWCGVYPNPDVLPKVKEVLGMPSNIVPLNIIPIGYPAENPEPKDKWKPENIHYNKW